jgi:mRNA interferase RelE/StbE
MYEVLLARQAERDLKKLSVENFRRVISEIQSLATEPRPPGCRKLTGSRNDYRIRVGSYRVIYEIDDNGVLVRIMRVRHRKEVYR